MIPQRERDFLGPRQLDEEQLGDLPARRKRKAEAHQRSSSQRCALSYSEAQPEA